MTPLFTSTLDYTYDVFMAYNKAINRKAGHLIFKMVTFDILYAVVAIWAFFQGSYLLGAILAVATVGYPIFVLKYSQDKMIKNSWDKNTAIHGNHLSYIFYEDCMEIGSARGNSTFRYSDFFRIYEVGGYFYLMVAKTNGIIVDKSKCSEGLIEFLRSKKR